MLRQSIKISAIFLAVGGVVAYAVLHRQLAALQLNVVAPPITDAFDLMIDAQDVLPQFASPVIGQRLVDIEIDPSHA